MPETTTEIPGAAAIRSGLRPASNSLLRQVTVLEETDSTNSWLLRLPADQRHGHLVVAERQSRGRGRRERGWHSPAGGNIYMSFGWRFAPADLPFATLSLVAGLCVCGALDRAGLRGHGVKWPNDILVAGEKLAGILVEMQSAGTGPAIAVLGLGLNVSMPGSPGLPIDRPWTDLASLLADRLPRNQLIALLLEELLQGLNLFEIEGFRPFAALWREWDLLRGQSVRLAQGRQRVSGIARGIDASGGLRLEVDGSGAPPVTRVFHAGEVSLRHG